MYKLINSLCHFKEDDNGSKSGISDICSISSINCNDGTNCIRVDFKEIGKEEVK